MTVMSNSASSPSNTSGLASAQSAPDPKNSFDEILSEKRSRWLFRVQLCLFLSIVAHIALFAYIHDKYILLKTNPTEKNPLVDIEKEKPLPMPIKEPRVVSGYDETRLDSPEIVDSIEQLTPTSPAEEQEFNDEKTTPSVDEFNTSLAYEFQTPDSPVLSEVPNLTPVEINEIEAPAEEVQPDISRTYNTEFNPSNIPQNIPLPEVVSSTPTTQYERPQSDFGSKGRQTIAADSSNVVLDVGDAEIIRPSVEDPTIPDTPSEEFLSKWDNQIPEQTISSVPVQIRPRTSVEPNSLMLAQETDLLNKASSFAPKTQTNNASTPAPAARPRRIPHSSYDTSTAYNDLTARDISKSIVLDTPPKPTTVSVQRDYNAGQGGLNGNQFKSQDAIPHSSVSIGAQAIISYNHNDVVTSDAFINRDPSLRTQMITSFGGDAAINQTIENGIKYLSKTQWPDGRWRFHSQPPSIKGNQQNGNIKCDTAATALALLSMLGAGYTHKEGPYKEEIQKGLDFLISNQQTVPIVGTNGVTGAVGAIYDLNCQYNYRSYAHAMSTIALCEAYGMTHDPKLLSSARSAVLYIIATQNKQLGGWRYETEGLEGQPHLESDTSVTGWQVMALRSAIAANVLDADDVISSLNLSQQWLDHAQDPQSKLYIYNPYNGTNSLYTHWNKTTPSMTAEGLFIQWCINPDVVNTQQAIPYLLNNLPGLQDDSDYSRDVYYWYYGTAIMFVQKGDDWKKWQSAIMPLLKNSQLPQSNPFGGSWDTEKPTVDKWSNYGGRHYITTMNLMILEIYTRHLSIYQ